MVLEHDLKEQSVQSLRSDKSYCVGSSLFWNICCGGWSNVCSPWYLSVESTSYHDGDIMLKAVYLKQWYGREEHPADISKDNSYIRMAKTVRYISASTN